ncbi:MAG: CCA tRNA nucleotidyltransferase [Oscillospiraceae bacterium]|nr:CCA tRNA nucleotidyltransferase [Oscillospiraceae bacterium]
MILPRFISDTISKIESFGFSAYAVGGCVRDSIMKKTPSDWDLTTSALPQDILKIFADHKTLTNGLRHGTVTVFQNGIPIEITTFRIDGEYSDNRHPSHVCFSDKLSDDLKRRDFTVNAMAFNPKQGITDLFGGMGDINAKTIRAVGNPVHRFTEDALRIMRAIRFSAVLGFGIEPQTTKAIFECKGLLANIARERITDEFTKTLTADSPSKILREYFAVTADIFFADLYASAQASPDFEAMNHVARQLTHRLTVYLCCSASALDVAPHVLAKKFFSNMKFSTAVSSETKALVNLVTSELPAQRIPLRKIAANSGISNLHSALCIKNALEPHNKDLNLAKQIAEDIRACNDCCNIQSLSINGSDLIEEFGLSGKEVGKALQELLLAVIEEKCENKKDALLSYYKSTSYL